MSDKKDLTYNLTPEQIEAAALKAMENFGAPELLGISDSEGNLKMFDMKSLSDEDVDQLSDMLEIYKKKD